MEKQVQLRTLRAVDRHHTIRRQRTHRHRAAEQSAHVVINQPVIKQIPEYGGDTGNGQMLLTVVLLATSQVFLQ